MTSMRRMYYRKGIAYPREPCRRLKPSWTGLDLDCDDSPGDGKEGKLRSEEVGAEGAELSEVLYVGVGGDECSKLPKRYTHLFLF